MFGLVASVLLLLGTAGVIVLASRHSPAPARSPAKSPAASQGSTATSQGSTAIGAEAQTRNLAASWVAQQVSRSAIVACDPLMCSALEARHIPVGDLLVLQPGAIDPLGSEIVVATASVRSQFGTRLASVYAPTVLASFGSGSAAVVIREIAPDGARAYAAGLRADVQARKSGGALLRHNKRVTMAAPAAEQLAAGQVDTRLLGILVTMANLYAVHIAGFADAAPGAAPGIPLRAVDLAGLHGASWTSSSPYGRSVTAFLRQQLPPYRPASYRPVLLPSGQTVLRIIFTAPSPFQLLRGKGSS
jgi:hypothetical protein